VTSVAQDLLHDAAAYSPECINVCSRGKMWQDSLPMSIVKKVCLFDLPPSFGSESFFKKDTAMPFQCGTPEMPFFCHTE
jgi:hypothetical protein